MRAGFFVVLALLAGALPAQAGRPRANEQRAVDLINRASGSVMRSPGCEPRPPRGTPTHDSPPQGLLDLFAILRRPATPEDALPGEHLRFMPGDVYVDYVRAAHAADGRNYWVIPARDVLHIDPTPQRCLHRIHARLRKLSKGEPARVRRRALHFYNEMVSNNRRLAHQRPREGVFVFDKRADGFLGGGGGGVDLTYLREHGMFGSSGLDNRSAVLHGLVPDGVATITSTFGTTYSRGPAGRKPRVYAKPIERTDPVQDNIVSFEVARSAEDAFPDKMVWRDADGKIVRVVRPRP